MPVNTCRVALGQTALHRIDRCLINGSKQDFTIINQRDLTIWGLEHSGY